jgi:hypothetical protein
MGLFESSRVTHFFHRRFLGSISPGMYDPRPPRRSNLSKKGLPLVPRHEMTDMPEISDGVLTQNLYRGPHEGVVLAASVHVTHRRQRVHRDPARLILYSQPGLLIPAGFLLCPVELRALFLQLGSRV